MSKVIALDLETTISKTFHEASPVLECNDYHTLIANDKVVHLSEGFKRRLPKGLLNGCDVLVGHNLQFDIGYILHSNEFKNWIKGDWGLWDIQLARYLMSGGRHKYPSLAELQEIYLGERKKESRISYLYSKGLGADLFTSDKCRIKCKRLWRLYNKYCLSDGVTTLQIYEKQVEEAKKLGMLEIIKIHCKAILGIVIMKDHGLKLNETLAEKNLQECRIKSLQAKIDADELIKTVWPYNIVPFKITSNAHKSALLFGGDVKYDGYEDVTCKNGSIKKRRVKKSIRVHGFGLWPEDLKAKQSKVEGVYTTDKDVLAMLGETNSNLAKSYGKLQRDSAFYSKMAETYLANFLKMSLKGKIHPNFNNCATNTGRLSSSNPNMQTLASSGEGCKIIKSCFVAEEGYSWVSVDYSQLEIYVVASITQDTRMIDDIKNGVDFHVKRLSWIDRLAKGRSYDELMCEIFTLKNQELIHGRKQAKGVSYQKAYGASAKSLAKTTGLPLKDVQSIFELEDIEYPKVKEFNDHLIIYLRDNMSLSMINDFAKKESVDLSMLDIDEEERVSKKKRRFTKDGIELLPIYKWGDDNPTFIDGEYRHYAVYTSFTGRRYCFEETGRFIKGRVVRTISPTTTKNWWVQGTAADIVQLATCKVLDYALRHGIDIKPVLQVHDSLEMNIKTDKINIHLPVICAIMGNIRQYMLEIFKYDTMLDFKVEAKVGRNMYEMEEYKIS